MKKILLLQDQQAENVRELLNKMVEVAGVEIELHASLTITSNRGEVLSAVKTMFGGTYFYNDDPLPPDLIGKPVITYQPTTPPTGVAMGIITPNDHIEQTRKHMIQVTDQLIEKTEELNFPPLRKTPREKGKKGRPEVRSWHVLLGGQEVEQITPTEKNRRLIAGGFETGTLLRHPKVVGLQRVTGEKGSPQGMEPVAE